MYGTNSRLKRVEYKFQTSTHFIVRQKTREKCILIFNHVRSIFNFVLCLNLNFYVKFKNNIFYESYHRLLFYNKNKMTTYFLLRGILPTADKIMEMTVFNFKETIQHFFC